MVEMETLLKKVNEKIAGVTRKNGPPLSELYEDAGLEEGKRLRARVFFMFSRNGGEKSVNVAAAIELLHAATLIHDDILDHSGRRRKNPALYARHGIPLSLLYGDYLFTSAFSLIAETEDVRLYKAMSRALKDILEGEMIENRGRGNIGLTKKEYLDVIEKKTGVLFGLACELGAIMEGMAESVTTESCFFGIAAGTAYQMMDDCADYFGRNPDKEKFKDLKEGFVTLPLIYFLEKCSDEEKDDILFVLSKGNSEDEKINKISFLMEHYGIKDIVAGDIKKILENADRSMPEYVSGDFNILSWIGDKINNEH
jgi:octaprenyl-diphosphate synthase